MYPQTFHTLARRVPARRLFGDLLEALHRRRVKTRMRSGEHEAASRLQQGGQRSDQGVNARHVHERHRAHCAIKSAGAERRQRLFIAGVEQVIVHVDAFRLAALAGALDERPAGVDPDHACSEPGQAPGEAAGAAGDVENAVAAARFEQALRGWLDQNGLELVAIADLIVPPWGVGIPDAAILLGVLRKLEV
jgi:hypothetical protein